MAEPVGVSCVVPTRDRAVSLERTIRSLLQQSILPNEILIVDSSEDQESKGRIEAIAKDVPGTAALRWIPASRSGAACQRNQGVAEAREALIWFFDDDVLFFEECGERLLRALESDPRLGGVSSMIVNQKFQEPGRITRTVYRMLDGARPASYAGRVIGPAVNLLPADDDRLPEVVPVEWLNLGSTLYRRCALPRPPFRDFFVGYSFLEDLALSSDVRQKWDLGNVRSSRIFHDSQSGAHKSDVARLAEMALRNRHFVMTSVLRRNSATDYLRLGIFQAFSLLSGLSSRERRPLLTREVRGSLRAIHQIARRGLATRRAKKTGEIELHD